MSFQSLLNELVEDVRGTELYECSRIDMMASEEGIMLLLRTRPQLSEKILATSPYHYPFEVVANARLVLWAVTRHIQRGAIFPARSELTHITRLSALHEYGISADEEKGVISVPEVKKDRNQLVDAGRWAQFLTDDPHVNPAFQGLVRGMDIHFVHVPDVTALDLSDGQMLHIAKLAFGWNYADLEKSKYMRRMAATIRNAALHAETVVEYGP